MRCIKPWTLLLESPGGLLSDAVTLGERVRAQDLRTLVRYRCASACSILFLGGVERVLWGSRAAIGFHQARSTATGECDQFGNSYPVYRMKEYVHEAAPADADRIVEIIMNTSCKSIEWIQGRRAVDLGVATKTEAESMDPGPELNPRRVE
jgi:hypothetical protein